MWPKNPFKFNHFVVTLFELELPLYICSSVCIPLFLVYVNVVPNYDDTKLQNSIDLPGAKNDFQADLSSLHKWSLDWGMEFNNSKCQVLHFSRKKYQTSAVYELNGHQLECFSQVAMCRRTL